MTLLSQRVKPGPPQPATQEVTGSMVKRLVPFDDFDGSPATDRVTFGYEGKHYLLDLNAEHAEQVTFILNGWVGKAQLIEDPDESAPFEYISAPGAEPEEGELADAGQDWLEGLSPVQPEPAETPKEPAPAMTDRDRNRMIRDWAIKEGKLSPNHKSKVPQRLVDEFVSAHA